MLQRILDFFRGNRRSGADRSAAAPQAHPRGAVDRILAEKRLDIDAVKIVRRLTRYDHEAYLVGGCVRDLLLDRSPKDYDIATSATPRQIKRLFRNSRIIGRRFKLAHIYFHGRKIIEVATFRAPESGETEADGEDADLLIRDDNTFGTVADDAQRRDFTVNALFYDVGQRQVIDHVGGMDDLEHRLMRAIGDPETRFCEDPIRILRAIKFAARLDFGFETKTLAALHATRDEIPKAAEPRILEEMYRFCRGGAARRSFELLKETKVFGVVLPELDAFYRAEPPAWELLLHYLDAIDRRFQEGEQAEAGEILAALIVPLIARAMGWPDGAQQPRGVNIRELVHEKLDGTSRRLRIARKDQELCRQLCQSLFRMVPARRARRSSRRGILHRDVFPIAVRMLETTAAEFGSDFSDAAREWKREAGRAENQAQKESTESSPTDTTDSARPSGPRRRSRRGGRGRGRSETTVDSEPKSAPKAKPEKPVAPRTWEDQDFFSALPTVPKMRGDADEDRYGADELRREDDSGDDRD
jgi:poly(A) polymerase